MRFRPEPAYQHGQAGRTAVVLVNLGSPDEPTAAATRRYLKEFLSDPRVVEIPKAIWWLILNGIILNVRPAKSAAKYASIWAPEGSPLKVGTAQLANGLNEALQAEGFDVDVVHAMRYGQPSVASVLDEVRSRGAQRVLVVPLYPQYAAATTASVFDAVAQWSLKARAVPEFRFVHRYGDRPSHIQALARSVRRHWAEHGQAERLVMSFHGLPERSLYLGDPYHCECLKTGRLLAEALGLSRDQVLVTFQSRFGKAKWLQPYTEPSLIALAQQGLRSVDVMCPGFAVDCLETLEEINQEAHEAFLHHGGERFQYIPCLNATDDGVSAMTDLVRNHLQGWPVSRQQTESARDGARAQATLARARGAAQ